ncbi:hypothetical protein [Photobacterium atrarenae]|uniref:Uncharacterized protein n=1 Tax=Photobacterium atrarenae TaxID=865757 RepID=A0ABY5GNZ4_9GAMM|nr:hypothetical protein [Photobacterium atrarenae]UTV30810.1 hypothetical protein NNL38_19830 [Photobacterium atrarenae]
MELDIKLSGTPEEIARFLREGGYGSLSERVISSMVDGKNISLELNQPDESRYIEAMEKVNMPTIFLAYLILRDGVQEEKVTSISFDELMLMTDLDNTRNISSRIGGLRKVTDSLGLKPVMEVQRRRGERYAAVHAYAYPYLLDFFNRNDHLLDEYAEEQGESLEFDTLDIPISVDG